MTGRTRRTILKTGVATLAGKTPEYISDEELAYMASHGDAAMYPALIKKTG